jgi:hypothetical protein
MPERLRAWVSGIALAADPRRAPALLLLGHGLWDGEHVHGSFEAWCVTHAGQACNLWVSAAWLHELVCDPALPLHDDRAVLGWARALLAQYHGEAANAWHMAAWRQGQSRGVSVLHGVALESLVSTAAKHGVRLASVRPWWSQALRLALHRRAAMKVGSCRLLVLEGARITVIELEAGVVTALTLRWLDAAHPDALELWVQDQAARATLAVGYGLAPRVGEASGVELLSPLDAYAPAGIWLNTSARKVTA